MTESVQVALISSSSTLLVSITALLLNYRLFNSLENRIGVLEKDFKDFYKTLLDLDNRLSKVEEKIK